VPTNATRWPLSASNYGHRRAHHTCAENHDLSHHLPLSVVDAQRSVLEYRESSQGHEFSDMPSNCYTSMDARFDRLFVSTAALDSLYCGCRWAEGPAYLPPARSLVWSDIPNDRMLRLDECSGAVSVFRQPAGYSNGNTVDRLGRLITCEHGNRRASRTEFDGTVITLADRFDGRRLNSPNDVVVNSDNSIWFTDPTA
jgi:hypothetical protein